MYEYDVLCDIKIKVFGRKLQLDVRLYVKEKKKLVYPKYHSSFVNAHFRIEKWKKKKKGKKKNDLPFEPDRSIDN